MNRRDFLKKSIILWAWLLTNWFSDDKIPEIDWKKWKPNLNWNLDIKENSIKANEFIFYKENVKKVSSNILNDNWNIEYKYNRSIELIWNNEILYFSNHFWIKTKEEFVQQIKNIQNLYWLNQDWILWEKTLKIIYIHIYSKNISILPLDIKLRYKEYIEMENYKPRDKNWKLIYPNHIPNVFNKNFYYWHLGTVNIPGTFIDKSLYNIVDKKINKKDNLVFLEKVNNKFIVKVYINWKLKLASYTSPWNPYLNWAINTPSWNFISTWASKYWISWAKISMWAPMPDAVHINMPKYSWIFCHAWNVDWRKRSHGCVRLPKKYSKWMYEIFRKYWDLYWIIQDS